MDEEKQLETIEGISFLLVDSIKKNIRNTQQCLELHDITSSFLKTLDSVMTVQNLKRIDVIQQGLT